MMRFLSFVVGISLLCAAGHSAEVLYNGIVLPEVWPPQRKAADLRTRGPMDVPYLKAPPAVIPIDVGRQLFVDDFLVAETTLTRRFHKAQLYADNPVLRPDKRWEEYRTGKFKKLVSVHRTAMAFSDGVFFDPQDKLFKMWYMPALFTGLCYATSVDGIHWEKPAMDFVPPSNLVQLSAQRDSSTVWLDHDAKNPQERFKMFMRHRVNDRGSLHTSPDGIHWSEPVWCGPGQDRTTMFYNPFRKVWVFSIKAVVTAGMNTFEPLNRPWYYRVRKYWESPDFLKGARWTGDAQLDWPQGSPQFWVGADKLDPPGEGPDRLMPQLYNLDATPYESLMLGLFTLHHGEAGANPLHPDQPKINDVNLAFSRDGFHWDRPFREPVIPVSHDPKTWNYGNVQSVGGGCLIVGDRLFMYASGRNITDDTTGLAFFRRDGFASMEAGDREGTLTTRPVKFSGRHLFVNVLAPDGELRVEVLDEAGKVIAPFGQAESIPTMGDTTRLKVRWKQGDDLSKLAGRAVSFRFHLKRGALYAFWVSPDASGASRGYVAAGGPGFTGATDTVGANGGP